MTTKEKLKTTASVIKENKKTIVYGTAGIAAYAMAVLALQTAVGVVVDKTLDAILPEEN